MNRLLTQKILAQSDRIEEWLTSLENDVPIFMSADVRDSGFKISSIDANLYPAGFNNLHESSHPQAAVYLGQALARYGVKPGARLLLISEEHTRNLFYLQNIYALSQILSRGGFSVTVATQFPIETETYVENALNLTTAKGDAVKLLDPRTLDTEAYDAVIMNHDSSAGTADWVKNLMVPVLPAWQAGWHTRSKAQHFFHYRKLMDEFGALVGLDSWFFCPFDRQIKNVDINDDAARAQIALEAEALLAEIQAKYDEYQIKEKPFVFLKSNHGTYGMAMLAFESAAEIKDINRKDKNKLFKGKSSVVVSDYLLQEGVPTIQKDAAFNAEDVIMLANNKFIGKFLRVNEVKDARTSLNSTGMYFKPIAMEDAGDDATRVSVIITRIAGIALQREICEITKNEPCFSY